MGRHSQSASSRILQRIRRHGRGWVFTSDDFDDLGAQTIIRTALKRFVESGDLRRLDRGLYDYPRLHQKLGSLAPNPDMVAKAVVGRAARLQPSGAYALNLLGLSSQVPMRIVYLTDDFAREVRVGNQRIIFKATTPKNMATAGKASGLVIQALRHLGRSNVDEMTITHLRNLLSNEDKKRLLKDIKYTPAWMAKVIRLIVLSE